ncbi:hypothetical protein Tsubulata_031628 [Turnera subulata]|uniref:BHLH domain-containing protein n=1 Tax=Turnera subulata TaxID=218843 RepID=A0A9Q0J4S3_9ROSI|nr:hypothetical protein Tsubulata_031628 [Turnera subulata]
MDPQPGTGARSEPDPVQFGEDIHHLITVPPDSASSFTALLELPPNQAVELLHSPESSRPRPPYPNLTFPADPSLIDRAARFSVYAANSPDATSSPKKAVKCEPPETPSPQPPLENTNPRTGGKRKKATNITTNKGSAKKSKSETNDSEEKLPYVHVRARRGQATDSHSLAERARREKINARMKLLQELVPGCNKVGYW